MTTTRRGWTRGHSGWAFGTALMFTLGIVFGLICNSPALRRTPESAIGAEGTGDTITVTSEDGHAMGPQVPSIIAGSNPLRA